MADTKVARLEGQQTFKLGKKGWLVLLIGAFAVALLSLGSIRAQQMQQQNQLQSQITQVQTKMKAVNLETLTQRQGELERQLLQGAAQSQSARAILSQPIDSIALGSTLFDIGRATQVKVNEIASTGQSSVKLEGVNFTVLTLSTKLEGTIPNLVSFATSLNNRLKTGFVKSVNINTKEVDGELETTADMQIVVYSYKGS